MPVYSPDGKFIAFRSERDGGGIFIMEETGENVRKISDLGYHPSWSPDAKQLVVCDRVSSLCFSGHNVDDPERTVSHGVRRLKNRWKPIANDQLLASGDHDG